MLRTILTTALTTATLAGAALGLSAGTALASTSGSVQLKGTVPLNCTVSVTDERVELSLTTGESARKVGSVVENCNSGTGYTIAITSANAGVLKSEGAGTTPIAYSIGYDGQSGGLINMMQVPRSTAQFNKSTSLTVTVPANNQYIAGSYADTVTITIAAK